MKLPRSQKALHKMLEAARAAGYQAGMIFGAKQGRELEQARLEAERKHLHMNALKEVTNLASAMGQTITSVVRGMESDKNQL